jgi:anti-sigma-K factor RskA
MSGPAPHDLAGYALGALAPEEARAVEAELARSPELRRELAEMRAVLDRLADAPPVPEPPRRLQRRTMAAVRREARGGRAGMSPRRTLAGAAVAVALVAVLVAGVRTLGGGPAGTLELEAPLVPASGGAAAATAEVRATGIGRLVHVRSDRLPILPRGEFYEVWFVGPGDAPGDPDRISAGTFHPDAEGRSDVRLTVAADPRRYGTISVTREPGDGDPAPGPEVLRSGG